MTNMGRFHGTACILLTILVSLLTACGTGIQQRASTQPGSQTTTGDSPSQPTTPSPAPTPTPTPSPTPTPVPVPGGPEHLYFGYSGAIYGFELHDDGTLTKTPNSPYSLGGDTQYTTGLTLNPAGTLGFASTGRACSPGDCYGTDSVSVYSVSSSTGELDLLRLDTSVGFLVNGVFDDSGRFLYQSTRQGIRAFEISEEGYISEINGSPFAGLFGLLSKSPVSDSFLTVGYTSAWDKIYASSFHPNPQDGSPLADAGPVSLDARSILATTIESQGSYLFALDGVQAVSNLHVFSIRTGITEVEGSPFTVATGGHVIAVDPNQMGLRAIVSQRDSSVFIR